jgi:hypothetical protein
MGGDMAQEGKDRVRLRQDEVEWRELEGEVVVLDLRRSTYLAVNRTGALLWRRLVEGATRAELVEKLMDEFGLEPKAARADLDSFLAELREQELLVEDP